MGAGIPTAVMVIAVLFLAAEVLLNFTNIGDPGGAAGAPSSGDGFIDALAGGIAHAEGYYNPLSRPYRNHNPGDITDTSIGGITATGKDSGGISIFASANDGWMALYAKLRNIASGGSSQYSWSMSLMDLANRWTGGDSVNGPGTTAGWASTVASKLSDAGYQGDPSSSLSDMDA